MLKHGTNRGWLAGCRKDCCERARQRHHAYRTSVRTDKKLVSAQPVIQRVRLLRSKYRWTPEDLAAETGMSRSQIMRWHAGNVSSVPQRNLTKIMSLPLKYLNQSEKHRVKTHASGAVRRLRALAFRGFSIGWISRNCNVSDRHLGSIRRGDHDMIFPETHDEIAELFRRTLSMPDPEGGHADRTRAQAREWGFFPFGAWDDIDDPDCEPEERFVSELQEDVEVNPDLVDAILRLRALSARGFQIQDVADEAGLSRSTLYKIAYGHRLSTKPDVVDKIHDACDSFEKRPDPEGVRAETSRTIARKKGWGTESDRI